MPGVAVHPGITHPRSRALSALRCAGLASRVPRPRFKTPPSGARSTRVNTPSHDNRDRVPGSIGPVWVHSAHPTASTGSRVRPALDRAAVTWSGVATTRTCGGSPEGEVWVRARRAISVRASA